MVLDVLAQQVHESRRTAANIEQRALPALSEAIYYPCGLRQPEVRLCVSQVLGNPEIPLVQLALGFTHSSLSFGPYDRYAQEQVRPVSACIKSLLWKRDRPGESLPRLRDSFLGPY